MHLLAVADLKSAAFPIFYVAYYRRFFYFEKVVFSIHGMPKCLPSQKTHRALTNIKVMIVTEANVVAFLMSIRVAPIANPNSCNSVQISTIQIMQRHSHIKHSEFMGTN